MHILRPADLGGRSIFLLGHLPQPGRALVDVFSLPPARRATAPLTEADLRRGTVVLSTLPQIHGNAPVAQIVELDELCAQRLPSVRIVHVAQGDARHWRQVDHFLSGLTASAYTLTGASESSRVSFTWAFGVGVLGQSHIARGLFALRDGVFLAADVPFNQMDAPDVRGFLDVLDGALQEARPFQ